MFERISPLKNVIYIYDVEAADILILFKVSVFCLIRNKHCKRLLQYFLSYLMRLLLVTLFMKEFILLQPFNESTFQVKNFNRYRMSLCTNILGFLYVLVNVREKFIIWTSCVQSSILNGLV